MFLVGIFGISCVFARLCVVKDMVFVVRLCVSLHGESADQ